MHAASVADVTTEAPEPDGVKSLSFTDWLVLPPAARLGLWPDAGCF